MTQESQTKVVLLPTDEDRIFDPEYVKDDEDFVSQTPTNRKQTKIPVQRPNKQQWFRVKSGNENSLPVKLVKDRDSNRYHLFGQNIKDEFARHLISVQLYLAITPQGTLFLIPVHKHDSMGRSHSAQESLMDICEGEAQGSWVRIEYNDESSAYDVFYPIANSGEEVPPDPVWPNIDWEDVLRRGFKDAYVLDLDHPFAKKLRGVL